MDFVLENFLSAVIYRVVMGCKTQVASSSLQHQDTVLDVQLARMLFINRSLTSFVAVVLTGFREGFLCSHEENLWGNSCSLSYRGG